MKHLGQGDLYRDAKALRVALGGGQPWGWLPFTAYESVPYNLSANATIFVATIPRALTIRGWSQAIFVATTNDGSNYWSLILRKPGPTTLATLTTASASADTWTLLGDMSIGEAVTTGEVYLWIRAEKTGSPGNLYLGAPAVFVT